MEEEEQDDLEQYVNEQFNGWDGVREELARGGPVDPECAKYAGELGVRIYLSDELVKKAQTFSTDFAEKLPDIWAPLLQRNLSPHPVTKLLLEGYEYVPPKPPSRWLKFKTSLRRNIARFLHDLSEKFEECGYRDY